MDLIDKLYRNGDLENCELKEVIEHGDLDCLMEKADLVRRKYYGDGVYIRGLIEISNFCKNDCYYCGIRKSNSKALRYRLSKDEILECVKTGYDFGFRTFVMQGGEDNKFSDEVMCEIISEIKERYNDCAITLSLGERSYESYKAMYEAGADRYLLRHETADVTHYTKLHPNTMSLENRKECLFNLKKIGYQTGSGFMVGSPYQTTDNLISDLRFLQMLNPHMIGIGPYICHNDTPFCEYKNGNLKLTLKMVSILRMMFPKSLIPSTTALSSISKNGRELGLKAGGNVVMPNLSPSNVRDKYSLYNNKAHSGAESAQGIKILEEIIRNTGYKLDFGRGDAYERR